MKEGLECSVKMNECVQVDGKGRDMKTSCGNSSLPSQPQQDNPSNQGMLWPLALWGLLGEAVPALSACFVPPSTATRLSSTKMVQAQWLQGPRICSFSLQKHRGWLGRWNICLWEKWVRYQKVNNWETAAVFLPHHPGALLKHTLINWRFSSVKTIPCTWGETIVPSRLRSAARSLYSSLWQGTRHSLVWEAQRGRLGIRTFLGTHLRGFLTVAREQFSKVSFYTLLIKHEKNREAVLYFHAVSLFRATHWDCTGFLRSSRFPHRDCSVCLTETPHNPLGSHTI